MSKLFKTCSLAIRLMIVGLSANQSLADTLGLKYAQILTGWQNNNGSHTAAVEINLETGWKTYWHTPGVAGIPPNFSFVGSSNLRDVKFKWPSPILFGDTDVWSIGYKDRLVLPMIITPQDPKKNVELNLNADIGICDTVCVPAELSMTATLLPKHTKRQAKVVAALASQPQSPKAVGAKDVICDFSMSQGEVLVSVDLSLPILGRREVIILHYADPDVWVQNKIAERRGNILSGSGIIHHTAGTMAAIDRSKIALSVVSETTAADVGTCAN